MTFFEAARPSRQRFTHLNTGSRYFPPRAVFAGGTPEATSKVREASRPERARTGHIVNNYVAPAVAVVAADDILTPSFSTKFLSPRQKSMPEVKRKKGREELEFEVVVRLTYLTNAILTLFCAVVVTSALLFSIL